MRGHGATCCEGPREGGRRVAVADILRTLPAGIRAVMGWAWSKRQGGPETSSSWRRVRGVGIERKEMDHYDFFELT